MSEVRHDIIHIKPSLFGWIPVKVKITYDGDHWELEEPVTINGVWITECEGWADSTSEVYASEAFIGSLYGKAGYSMDEIRYKLLDGNRIRLY